MRAITHVVIASLIVAATTGASGCFRPGPGRAANITMIVAGSALAVGAVAKAEYAPAESHGQWEGSSPIERGLLLGAAVAGIGLAINGVVGLTMSPDAAAP